MLSLWWTYSIWLIRFYVCRCLVYMKLWYHIMRNPLHFQWFIMEIIITTFFSQQDNTNLIEYWQSHQHCTSLQEAVISLNEVTFSISRPVVNDINITLMRTPQEVKEDKSVFMNQGEWELLHVLSKYKSFSVDNDDYYAEMKFHVCTTSSHCSLLYNDDTTINI